MKCDACYGIFKSCSEDCPVNSKLTLSSILTQKQPTEAIVYSFAGLIFASYHIGPYQIDIYICLYFTMIVERNLVLDILAVIVEDLR